MIQTRNQYLQFMLVMLVMLAAWVDLPLYFQTPVIT